MNDSFFGEHVYLNACMTVNLTPTTPLTRASCFAFLEAVRATCAVGSVLQGRRWWSDPGGVRSSTVYLSWQRSRAETVGAGLARGGRPSARQPGVEIGCGSFGGCARV